MLHPSSPPWHPTRLHAYRVIHLPTMHEAAATVLDAYVDAQLIKWAELVELRREIPRGQPGPFTSALVAICAPTAYVVHQVLHGWPAAHVVSIRWPAPWERLIAQEVRHAA